MTAPEGIIQSVNPVLVPFRATRVRFEIIKSAGVARPWLEDNDLARGTHNGLFGKIRDRDTTNKVCHRGDGIHENPKAWELQHYVVGDWAMKLPSMIQGSRFVM
jgi:hypothetical protein